MEWECDEATKKACYSKGKSQVRRALSQACLHWLEGWYVEYFNMKVTPSYDAMETEKWFKIYTQEILKLLPFKSEMNNSQLLGLRT